MSRNRTITDFPRNEPGLVDKFIGTAYDIVKRVGDNIPEIQRLDGVLTEIEDIAQVIATDAANTAVASAMIPVRTELADAIAHVTGVSTHVDEVATSIQENMLVNATTSLLTARGTEFLNTPDRDTLVGFAGRGAYMLPTRVAYSTPMTNGLNIIPLSSLLGQTVNPRNSTRFKVMGWRNGTLINLAWSYVISSASLRVDSAVSGDILLALEQDVGIGDISQAPIVVNQDIDTLTAWLGSFRNFQTSLQNTTDPTQGVAVLGRTTLALRSLTDLQLASRNTTQLYNVRGFYSNVAIGGGLFYWDPTFAKSRHNGWRIIDPLIVWDGSPDTLSAYLNATGSAGNGCFVRLDSSVVSAENAGAIADWNGTTGTDATESIRALIKDTAVKRITGSGGSYWVGNFALNEQKFVIKRPVIFEWNWSTFVGRGEGSAMDSASSMFFFEDTIADIGWYNIVDLSYNYTIAGRGIQGVTIVSRTKSTRGHTIGPCHVASGQSVLTCAPMAVNNFRISGVRFRGAVTFGTIYYGVNLADNGDDVSGFLSGVSTLRSAYVYGVKDIYLNMAVEMSIASSGSLLISQQAGSRPTENINIKIHYGEINGPILIATDPSTGGAGTFRNITLDVLYDALGSNIPVSAPLIKMGCYDTNSELITETRTVSTDNIRLSIHGTGSTPVHPQPIIIYTPSPNHGRWYLNDGFSWEPFGLSPVNAAGVFNTPIFISGNRRFMCVSGDLTKPNTKVRIPTRHLVSRRANQELTIVLRIAARSGVGSASATRIEQRNILGYVDGDGKLTLTAQSSGTSLGFGTPDTTFTVAASTDFKFLEVSASAYTGGSASLVVSFDIP